MLLVKTDPFATEISGTVRHFIADLRALESAILLTDETQPREEFLQASVEFAEFVPRLRSTLEEHVARLTELIGEHPEDLAPRRSGLPSAQNRGSQWPRDACAVVSDYCSLLNLAALGYTMLHARCLALHDPSTAKLALSHLQEIIPLVHLIHEAAPRLAIQELTHHFGGLVPSAADTSVRNTRDAWSQAAFTGSVH